MGKKRIEHQAPDVLAMILADTVLQEVATGKFFLQGTYSHITGSNFPLVYPVLTLYFAITNGHGKTPVKIRLIDVDESRNPIFEIDGMVDFADPLQVCETVFSARGVQFPLPGQYRLQLFCAGQLLRERRLQVMALPGSQMKKL